MIIKDLGRFYVTNEANKLPSQIVNLVIIFYLPKTRRQVLLFLTKPRLFHNKVNLDFCSPSPRQKRKLNPQFQSLSNKNETTNSSFYF